MKIKRLQSKITKQQRLIAKSHKRKTMIVRLSFIVLASIGLSHPLVAQPFLSDDGSMAKIPAGQYRALYSSQASPLEWVKAFKMDVAPVTNQEFYEFLKEEESWRKDKILPMFAEPDYLKHWEEVDEEYQPKEQDRDVPVTFVSWFAAQAYCKAQDKRLPTNNEWEYAALASETQPNGSDEPGYTEKILEWYAKPRQAQMSKIKQDEPNYWGVYDLHGLIWEWTQNFGAEAQGDLKKNNVEEVEVDGRTLSLDIGAFCGAGAQGVADPTDYASFMRFGFRASLKAPFALHSLGFRCVENE